MYFFFPISAVPFDSKVRYVWPLQLLHHLLGGLAQHVRQTSAFGNLKNWTIHAQELTWVDMSHIESHQLTWANTSAQQNGQFWFLLPTSAWWHGGVYMKFLPNQANILNHAFTSQCSPTETNTIFLCMILTIFLGKRGQKAEMQFWILDLQIVPAPGGLESNKASSIFSLPHKIPVSGVSWRASQCIKQFGSSVWSKSRAKWCAQKRCSRQNLLPQISPVSNAHSCTCGAPKKFLGLKQESFECFYPTYMTLLGMGDVFGYCLCKTRRLES